MRKIGEFSKATGMTIKALRHYEALGLIQPYWIDKYTGYRYYDDMQVRLVKHIAYLKSLGFSLKEIQCLVSDNLSEVDWLRIYENKKRDVKGQLEQAQWRLTALEQQLTHASSHKILEQNNQEITMDLEIKKLAGFKVAGLLYTGKNQNHEITALWQEFNRRGDTLCPADTKVCYGVCRVQPYNQEGEFEYLAGVQTDGSHNLPKDVVIREVPPCEVAVFKHTGSAETLGQTYQNIYTQLLPASAYQPLESGLDLEVYTEEFTFFAPDSVMYIYVPIKPK